MNIWLDITNAPHINFFAPIIQELEAQHTVVITTRDHSNTIDLLKLEKLPFAIVGSHYGAKSWNKLYGFFHRALALRSYLLDKRIDVAISHSSFYSPFVARLIGCPSIYLNDNEHALGNLPAFLFADKIMIPETLDVHKLGPQWLLGNKVIQYPGLKEGIYLQSTYAGRSSHHEESTTPRIYIRPEPWNAQYYKGNQEFLDPLINALAKQFFITILPRGRNQAEHYLAIQSDRVTVITGAMALADIYRDCAVFIGAGGTMTREMAILGVPTISVYQDTLLDVDRYLIQHGFMTYIAQPTVDDVHNVLRGHQSHDAGALIDKGLQARQLILNTLVALGQPANCSSTR